MNNTNFASLSSGLLARKGGAKPAMRPQVAIMPGKGGVPNLDDLGWNDMGEVAEHDHPVKDNTILHLTPEPANQDARREAQDNDRAADAELTDRAVQSPPKPVIVEQQESLPEKLTEWRNARSDAEVEHAGETEAPAEPAAPADPVTTLHRRSALSRGKRAAFTLRLDAERHLKLRLACTVRNVSAQQMVTDALDRMLGTMPEITTLARRAGGDDAPQDRVGANS